jgi:Bacterial regulatory helix-turn-helix protein, lysR family
MDRLASMAAFVKAVELGTFAAAAAALDVSGPMIGKHVRFLEERLGVREPTMNAAARFWPKQRLRTRWQQISYPNPAESYASPCPCYSADGA